MVDGVIEEVVSGHCPPNLHREEWDLEAMVRALQETIPISDVSYEDMHGMSRDELVEYVRDRAYALYEAKEAEIGQEAMREIERMVMLRVVDAKWMEHLDAMDTLREGVGLRAYGQRDPLVEYKTEAFDMYQAMLSAIHEETVRFLFHVQVSEEPEPDIQPFQWFPRPQSLIFLKRPPWWQNTVRVGHLGSFKAVRPTQVRDATSHVGAAVVKVQTVSWGSRSP